MKPFQQHQEIRNTVYRLERLRELIEGSLSREAVVDASPALETLLVNMEGPCSVQRAWNHLGFSKCPIIETNTISAPTAIFTINGASSEAKNNGYAVLAPSVRGNEGFIKLHLDKLDEQSFMTLPQVGPT